MNFLRDYWEQLTAFILLVTILTRMGRGSKCFVLADPMQTDIKWQDKQGAFTKMNNIFSDEESFNRGIRTFKFTEDDIMRSELVKFLIKKLRKHRNE